MEKILKTIILILLFCFIWQALELMIYGTIQTRLVDDIIMILLIPIFYKAV